MKTHRRAKRPRIFDGKFAHDRAWWGRTHRHPRIEHPHTRGRNVSTAAKELSVRDFESRFRDLVRQLGQSSANTGCVASTGCKSCSNCTFCTDSERLIRCHYCVRCLGCTDSSHCRDGKTLIGCQHCIECEGCTSSAYLVKSVACSGCNYCFGCAGLSGKDFHILNEPYSRGDYFAITRKLNKELGL